MQDLDYTDEFVQKMFIFCSNDLNARKIHNIARRIFRRVGNYEEFQKTIEKIIVYNKKTKKDLYECIDDLNIFLKR